MRSPLSASTCRTRLARRLALLLGVVVLMAAWRPVAADAADAPPVNLLSNPGFEGGTHVIDNLWDGVDSDGYLSSFRHSAQVITERGSLGALAMPPAVALADLNGDGKLDLITADPSGYFRFYANRGTATAPKFTTAELIPIFLSTTFKPLDHEWQPHNADFHRFCPRFALADWRHTGVLDLLVGNYYGETLFVPNTGTAKLPVFRQPSGPGGVTSARLPTSEKQPFWGNLLAPAAIDFGGGRLDLLLGEGTYSANSIHLLRNVSNGGVPKFTDAQHTHLAYGDGREQLLPAVVDYDGDGNPDVLVADRTGEVGVYLNPGKAQQLTTEFKRAATISFGGRSKLPGLCSIYAADFNGDGLFDLILGMSNGHIAVSLNTGSKGNPAFGPIQDLKGEDRLGRNINLPDGWNTSNNAEYGNALSYFTVVDAQSDPASAPPEGTHCLKAGYWPLPGETFLMPAEGIPGAARHFVLHRSGLTVNNNKPYELSFRVKGSGIEKMRYSFASHFEGVPDSVKIERGERGEVKNKDAYVSEWVDLGNDFSVGSNWGAAGGTLNIHYANNLLRDKPTMTGGIYIDFWMTSRASVIYFDDFKFGPRQ